MSRACVAGVILFGLAAGAVASEPINRMCPVLTEVKADPKVTTVYQGKTIAFCCDQCRAKFNADPERYVHHLPEFAKAEGTTTTGVSVSEETPLHGEENHFYHSAVEQEDHPFLARIHPIIVHFPVVGIPLALLGFLTWVVTGRDGFSKADVPALMIAALAAIAAVITGDIAHDSIKFSPTIYEIVERHQIAGITTMILALVLAALRLWRWNTLVGRWRWIYGIGLAVATVSVGITGYLGGSVVFGPDHFRPW